MIVTLNVPRGADNTVLDYTWLGLDIEFPNKSGISAVGEDLIDLSELDIRSIDEGNINQMKFRKRYLGCLTVSW